MKKFFLISLLLAGYLVSSAQKKEDSTRKAADSVNAQTLVLSYEEYVQLRTALLELKVKDGLPILMYLDRKVQDRIDKILGTKAPTSH